MLTDPPTPEDYAAIIVPLPVIDAVSGASARGAQLEEFPARQKQVEPSPVQRHPFQMYIVGQASAGAWPVVKCAWGTVCSPHTANDATTITARTDSFTLEANALFWLEVGFDSDGAITTCELVKGTTSSAWTEYPEQFTADGQTWYHPIAHVRAALGSPIESGEIVVHSSGVVLAQLTNTHLRVTRACGMDAAMTRHWKLEPGPGAVV